MKPSTALLEWPVAKGEQPTVHLVSYVVTARKSDELTIKILRVVPARAEDSLVLGQPITPSRELKTLILRRLGALEFGLTHAPGESANRL